jgi:hypothetical protein
MIKSQLELKQGTNTVDPLKVYHYAAACSYIPYVAAAYESTRPGPGSRTCQARGPE